MKKRDYIVLYAVTLALLGLVCTFQTTPGYMDADYYYLQGRQLAQGNGFAEQILWNYLDDPAGLPHPAHLYWMPLPSLIAALGMLITGQTGYLAARIPFLLLASFIPVCCAWLCYELTQNRRSGLLAGVLGTFSGFYIVYYATTDNFVPQMLLGTLWMVLLARVIQKKSAVWTPVLLGVICGLFYLGRADGVLWLALALLCILLNFKSTTVSRSMRVRDAFVTLAAALTVMIPWLIRNQFATGSFFPAGGSKSLWILSYDEIFSYPASILTAERYFQAGLGSLLQLRLDALGFNLKNLLAVQGGVIFLPLSLIGAWKLRRDIRVQLGFLAWLAVFGIMTVVFPQVGARGGYLHSAALIQPLLWALVPAGLSALVDLGAKRRNWKRSQALSVFSIGLGLIAVVLTAFVFWNRVIGSDAGDPAWNLEWKQYAQESAQLTQISAEGDAVVMVKNPAGYSAVTGQPAIMIPNGGEETSLAVADRYHATLLILEPDHVAGLDALYTCACSDGRFQLLGKVEDALLYRILPASER